MTQLILAYQVVWSQIVGHIRYLPKQELESRLPALGLPPAERLTPDVEEIGRAERRDLQHGAGDAAASREHGRILARWGGRIGALASDEPTINLAHR